MSAGLDRPAAARLLAPRHLSGAIVSREQAVTLCAALGVVVVD